VLGMPPIAPAPRVVPQLTNQKQQELADFSPREGRDLNQTTQRLRENQLEDRELRSWFLDEESTRGANFDGMCAMQDALRAEQKVLQQDVFRLTPQHALPSDSSKNAVHPSP
jgi:hypothetical protein